MSEKSNEGTAGSDVIVLPVGKDRWVAYNLFARTALGLDARGLEILGGGTAAEGRVWRIGWFSNEEGTLADPTRFRRDIEKWGEGESLDAPSARALFRETFLVVEDAASYRRRFQRKKSPLDRESFGNFHDQVGTNLLFRRQAAFEWWLGQKFTKDLRQVRPDNLYGAVQWPYLSRYFPTRITPGMRVVDLGCGTGIYSRLIADCGAEVLGIDPGSDYLAIARQHFQNDRTRFAEAAIGTAGALDFVEDELADVVFMSDALLFYFVKIAAKDSQDLSVLLRDIRRMLKPGGTFISVEPHPVFYLSPWLGEPEHPYTAVTEYRNRTFTTTPNFAQTIQALTGAGFLIRWMDELYASPSGPEVEPRAQGFAEEFPLWTLFEMVKSPA